MIILLFVNISTSNKKNTCFIGSQYCFSKPIINTMGNTLHMHTCAV